jgi:hypothetical protein
MKNLIVMLTLTMAAAILCPAPAPAGEKPMLHIKLGEPQPEVSLEGWTQISDMYIPKGTGGGEGGGVIRFPLPPDDYFILVYVPSSSRELKETSVTVHFNDRHLQLEPQEKGELIKGQNWSRFHGRVTADMFEEKRSQTLRLVGDGPVLDVAFRGSLPPAHSAGTLRRTGWNVNAQQYIFSPTFWVEPLSGASAYAVTVQDRTGRTSHTATSWRSETVELLEQEEAVPYQGKLVREEAVALDLTSIWNRLPATNSYVAWIDAFGPDGQPLGGTEAFVFHKPEQFRGVTFDPATSYLDSARKNFKRLLEQCREDKANGLPPLGGYRMSVQFPTRIYCQVADGFLAYAAMGAETPAEKQEAISIASYFGEELLKTRLEKGPYKGMTRTHTEAWKKGKNWLQPNRAGMAGTTLLKLHKATGDKKFMDAAIQIAQALKSTQLDDGRWVFRVDVNTGEVINDYTSDLSEIILFLDQMIEMEGHNEFTDSRDRVVKWMLDTPVKTMNWPNAYEDTVHRPAYVNLQHWDVEYFIRHLLRHATAQNGYQKIAEDLGQWVEDQFVIWETSDLPMWMGPGAKEKYSFRKLDVCGPLLRMYQDLHEGTGNPVYLEKATLIANALTRYQMPNGFFPTFPVYMQEANGTFVVSSRFNAIKVKGGPGVWPNNTAYTGQWLLEFGRYVNAVEDSRANKPGN